MLIILSLHWAWCQISWSDWLAAIKLKFICIANCTKNVKNVCRYILQSDVTHYICIKSMFMHYIWNTHGGVLSLKLHHNPRECNLSLVFYI